MKTWAVGVTYVRTDWYEVEAETGEKAKEIVLSGEEECMDHVDGDIEDVSVLEGEVEKFA